MDKAMAALRAIKVHPLGSDTNLAIVDTTKEKMNSSFLRWEDNGKFWTVLKQIVDEEPIVPSFLPMYGLLAELGIEKGKPFAPNARMTDILDWAAKAGRDQMLVSAFDSAQAMGRLSGV